MHILENILRKSVLYKYSNSIKLYKSYNTGAIIKKLVIQDYKPSDAYITISL